MDADHSVIVSCLQLALELVRGHFQAVYDLTIYYEGYGCTTAEGGRTRGPPPDLFGGRSYWDVVLKPVSITFTLGQTNVIKRWPTNTGQTHAMIEDLGP